MIRRMPLLAVACLPLAACGTYIPSQRDWPDSGPRLVADMNATLVRSIVCELSYAATIAIENDLDQARARASHRAYASFLSDWGVEVATDLTVAERSSLGPSGTWTPSAVFALAGGLNGTAEATNENQFNVFYTMAALYKPTLFRLNDDRRPCRDPRGNKEGSPLVDIDLQILPLLESRVQVVQLGFAAAPEGRETVEGEKNVLTQTVSIKETVSGSVTPSWKFTTGSVDAGGDLFGAGRDRTHRVVFTFGPLAPGRRSLSPLAEAFHLNEQLKAGLRDTSFNVR